MAFFAVLDEVGPAKSSGREASFPKRIQRTAIAVQRST
jgi:hypothetical protein